MDDGQAHGAESGEKPRQQTEAGNDGGGFQEHGHAEDEAEFRPDQQRRKLGEDEPARAADGKDEQRLAENKRHDPLAGKAEHLHDGDLEAALPDGKEHGVHRYHQDRHEGGGNDEADDQADIGILPEEGFEELLFRLRLRLSRRIGK